MITLKETIVVEGRYDKARLANLFDAPIIETGGFSIFRDKQRLKLLRRLAMEHGIILLTDSDGAGFKIRNYISGAIPNGRVVHIYIPDLPGKESRKSSPSAEGKLGVEGVPDTILLEAFRAAGLTGEPDDHRPTQKVTKQDFYDDGISGGDNSATRRRALCENLGLPTRLGTNALLKVINSLVSYNEYKNTVNKL